MTMMAARSTLVLPIMIHRNTCAFIRILQWNKAGLTGLSRGHAGPTQVRFSSASATETQPKKVASEEPGRLRTNKDLFAYRFVYPEFLPATDAKYRNRLREMLERRDMLNRRTVIEIPEFYVGSILAVAVTDPYAPSMQNRFVGICILRQGEGLRHQFTLRNVIDNQGVEIMYDMYNPTIQKVEVLRLEKRLDDHLVYLRDALPEYSTFPLDMKPEPHAEGAPVPLNPLKVKMKPRPWYCRWERMQLRGVEELVVTPKMAQQAERLAEPWEKFDLMKEYRRVVPEEEQERIWAQLREAAGIQRRERRRMLKQHHH